jgi:hypothetical protein
LPCKGVEGGERRHDMPIAGKSQSGTAAGVQSTLASNSTQQYCVALFAT